MTNERTLIKTLFLAISASFGPVGLSQMSIAGAIVVTNGETPAQTAPWAFSTVENAPDEFGQWVVQIEVNKQFVCAGTLVSPSWVLTVGHCTPENADQSVSVRVGSHRLGEGQQIAVSRIIRHPEYENSKSYGNVALLRLSKPYLVTKSFPAVDLMPSVHVSAAQSTGTVRAVGWGIQSAREKREPGDLRAQLAVVQFPLVPVQACRKLLGADEVASDVICAGRLDGGDDTCQGDSGAPLFVDVPVLGRLQLGMVSWGSGCGEAAKPGVYVSVAAHSAWIRSTMGAEVSTPSIKATR